MKVGKYVVISTCGSEECNIIGKGVTGVFPADTFEQALEIVDDIVKDFMDNIGRILERNIPYGDDLCECDSIIYSAYFLGNNKAWIRANLEDWERVEIFEFDEDSERYINISTP